MPRKRRSSFGSVTTMRPGVQRIRYWADKGDGKGYRRCSETVRGSYRDAKRRLAEVCVEHAGDAPCPTVSQAFERWWMPDEQDRLARGEVARQTHSMRMSTWRNHVEPVWGAVQLRDVRPLGVQEWLLGLSRWQARDALNLLRQVFAIAVRYEVVDANPAAVDYRMPKDYRKGDEGVYTLPELARMWRGMSGALRVAFTLSAFGSCRTGESLGASRDCVKRMERASGAYAAVEIRGQVTHRGREVVDRLKTEQSGRFVIVPPPYSRCIFEAAESHWWLADDGSGAPIAQSTLTRAWRRWCAENGIEHHPPKNLRKSWRTWMAGTGLSFDLIEKLMGHVGTGVSEKYYIRLTPGQMVDIMDSALAGSFKAQWDESLRLGQLGTR